MANARFLAMVGFVANMLVLWANIAMGQTPGTVTLLDGNAWRIATDPQNIGREQKWFEAPRPDAKATRVPWIIQEAFPGYHGVAWYWRDFDAPVNPHDNGHYLLRFWQVDYLAEVWLNGTMVGRHEGGESSFTLDITRTIKPGQKNRLAVRVLNPTNTPIDGIVLKQTGKRCKSLPFSAGGSFNHGGITESVELLCVAPVYVDDLYVLPRFGEIKNNLQVRATVRNTAPQARRGTLEISVAPALTGKTTVVTRLAREFRPGDSTETTDLTIDSPRLWQLGDPYLYRVTVRVQIDGAASIDEQSTRCGFRDFRFSDGYFRLNGKRLLLRSCHTCNHYPIGMQFPHDPDLLRRDLLNLKVMGFNAVRFIWGAATPVQLDLCDELGFMVYEETYVSCFGDWTMQWESPALMTERFNSGISEIIRRDRNHPSVVMWGLLNEASNSPGFHLAVKSLPLVRRFDDSRVVMLNSGRFDAGGIGTTQGIVTWPPRATAEPWIGVNTTAKTIETLGITWPGNRLAMHPGPKNEKSVVRWTAPATGDAEITVNFVGFAKPTTTDVHVFHKNRSVFDAVLNIGNSSNEATMTKHITVAAGDTIDAVVGWGNGNHGADTTGLTFQVKLAGKTYDATHDFTANNNPNGPWSYGQLAAGEGIDTTSFVCYAEGSASSAGSISNPGSKVWEDIISDRHIYPRVPHTADTIDMLRKVDAPGQHVFLSEYGIGSGVDLWRTTRHYEECGAAGAEDAQFVREMLGRYLNDWKQWRLDELYARPEDYFMESLKKMAGQRILGFNAIRANPNIVAHSMTCAIEEVMCGEGLTTAFREFKPGTIDAMHDNWSPLRWCLFAEPVHVYRGAKVHLEAVLADEDVLQPGEYPVRLQVIGPNLARVMDRETTVRVLPNSPKNERPFAKLCFSDDVTLDVPTGKCRFLATFLRGGAPVAGTTEFYVTDRAEMPKVDAEVVLWGDDPQLAAWLKTNHIRTRPFVAAMPAAREIILASDKPAGPNKAEAFAELAQHVARGSTAVFLSPRIFAEKDDPTRWLPLAQKGTLPSIWGWLYLKDEWAKRHPIFNGLPSGALMEYDYYREIIPDLVWQGQKPPDEAVAGAIKSSQDYCSGLMVSVYRLGAGRVVLNTLQIRENLDSHPAAERLLRNMLIYAARDCEKRPAELPVDFGEQLKALHYK